MDDKTADEDAEKVGWGVEEAQQRNQAEASTWSDSMSLVCLWLTLSSQGLATQLALAYAIHKSFIFVRVPLTAAITPKVVKVLRSWGWQIGKRRTKK